MKQSEIQLDDVAFTVRKETQILEQETITRNELNNESINADSDNSD